jgi:hypothetical protein
LIPERGTLSVQLKAENNLKSQNKDSNSYNSGKISFKQDSQYAIPDTSTNQDIADVNASPVADLANRSQTKLSSKKKKKKRQSLIAN